LKILKAMELTSDVRQRGARRRSHACGWLIAGCMTCLAASAPAANRHTDRQQQPAAEQTLDAPPLTWVQAAVDNELKVIAPDGLPAVRCRQRRIDAKGDTTRELIETQEGTVARLVERDGRPLTASEDADERQRLQGILDSPGDFLKHHARDKQQRDDAVQLVRLLPQAMLYSYTPGQPQPKGAQRPQIVIDYQPNPAFHPPSTRAELLSGIEGRVLRPVDFGYGLVARVFPGGTIEFEQADAGNGRWVYSHITEDVTVRILMVKNILQKSEATSWDFRLLPAPPHFQDAIRMLLEMKIPLSS
jgi:hypothetical protein